MLDERRRKEKPLKSREEKFWIQYLDACALRWCRWAGSARHVEILNGRQPRRGNAAILVVDCKLIDRDEHGPGDVEVAATAAWVFMAATLFSATWDVSRS
jgi:hypothetical protein